MGKTRGHGSRRPGRGRGRGRGDGSDDDEDEPQRLGGQSNTVGMLPPSDSDEEEEVEEGKEGDQQPKEATPAAAAKPAGQPKTAGQLPPSDSDADEEESEEEESSEEPVPEYLAQPSAPRRKKVEEEEPDPEQIRKDLERLEMIKKKREDDRLKRIREEGWDRFAPVSDTNKPPGHLPPDHPSLKQSS